MRKLLFCVPMMILLLSACTGGAEGNEAEELALQIRGEYLAMSSCAGQAAITADYGQRVYQYELAVAVDGEETTLTLSAPALQGRMDSWNMTVFQWKRARWTRRG